MSKTRITENDYLFLTSMLRAREPYMLTREKMERMLEAESFDDAARILSDCGYGDVSGMDAEGVESVLASRRAEVFKELGRVAPEQQLVDIFRLKYDYHNAKVLIKSQAANVDAERLLSNSGRVSPADLKDSFNNDRLRDLPEVFGEAISEGAGILARSNNPQLADFALDRSYFKELLTLGESLAGDFMKEYIRLLIDISNLRAVIRTLRMGRGEEFLKTALIPGGSVDAESIISSSKSTEKLVQLFAPSGLKEAAALGIKAIAGGTLTEFELYCDNAAMKFLTKAKSKTFGDEPVIAYLAAMDSEITAVRMILTGKLSGVKKELIRERLRETYA